MTRHNAAVGIVIVVIGFMLCATGSLSLSRRDFIGLGAEADSTSTISLPLARSSWQELAVGTVPLGNDQDGNLSFAFPVVSSQWSFGYACGTAMYTYPDSINYLYTIPGVSSIDGYNSISVSLAVNTTGSVVFNYQTEPGNTCECPAHVRAFIWQSNDVTQGYDRWFSNSVAYELTSGTAILTTPLTPDQWSSVDGALGNSSASATQGFYDALNNIRYVGVVFGGGCFFGHGVNVSSGTAQFTLRNYRIQ